MQLMLGAVAAATVEGRKQGRRKGRKRARKIKKGGGRKKSHKEGGERGRSTYKCVHKIICMTYEGGGDPSNVERGRGFIKKYEGMEGGGGRGH